MIITKGYHTKMRHRSFLILSIFLIYGQGCLKVIHIPPVELGDRNAYTCSCLCGPGLNDDNLLFVAFDVNNNNACDFECFDENADGICDPCFDEEGDGCDANDPTFENGCEFFEVDSCMNQALKDNVESPGAGGGLNALDNDCERICGAGLERIGENILDIDFDEQEGCSFEGQFGENILCQDGDEAPDAECKTECVPGRRIETNGIAKAIQDDGFDSEEEAILNTTPACGTGECGNLLCERFDDGTDNFNKCTFSPGSDDCSGSDTETTIVCRVPLVDPPLIFGGIAELMTSNRSIGRFDGAQSFIQLEIKNDTINVPIFGKYETRETSCPGPSCTAAFYYAATARNFNLDGRSVTNANASISTGDHEFPVSPTGLVVIPPHQLLGAVSADLDGQRTAFYVDNPDSIVAQLDKQGNVHGISGVFSIAVPGRDEPITIQVFISGKLTNQNPTAVAGSDQTLECNSLGTAPVVLDGSQSLDPDGGFVSEWWRGVPAPGNGIVVARTPIVSTLAVLGTTDFYLRVKDGMSQLSEDLIQITVEDTTDPQFSVYEGPTCLWPPNHKYVVLRLDREFSGIAEDVCDPAPSVTMVSATSDQPDNGTGDGNTTNDTVVFPDHVCLRAERAGNDQDGRLYTIGLQAADDSGNQVETSVQILVPHNQNDPSCRTANTLEIVSDSDPLCATPALGTPSPQTITEANLLTEETMYTPPVVTAERDTPPVAIPATANCSISEPSSNSWLSSLFAVLVLAFLRRKPSQLQVKRNLLLVGFSLFSCRVGGTNSISQQECLVGWWMPPVDQACQFVCQNQPAPAECQQADCRQQVFQGFTADGKTFSGAYVYSVSKGTLSSLVTMLGGTYVATSETLSVNYSTPSEPGAYSCEGDKLILGFQVEARIPLDISSVLDSASIGSGIFTEEPFSPP